MKANDIFCMLYCAGLLVMVALSGCGVTAKKGGVSSGKDISGIGNRIQVERRGDWRMSHQAGVFLAWPEADAGSGTSWPRTRTHLARQLVDQARKRFQSVTPAVADDSPARLFELAGQANADFVMKLLIHHVDSPSDFPVTRLDTTDHTRIHHKQLKMSLQVFEASSGRLLDTVNATARRPWYMSDLIPGSPLAEEAITLMLDQLIH